MKWSSRSSSTHLGCQQECHTLACGLPL
uniref:Uncharacterized protein n=1 Tax=Arundo donax TaxID=35708 RepID=A0A0A8ZRH2_ARUDO